MFLENAENEWPQSPQATFARRILPAYLRHGPQFASNADVAMRIWRAGDQVLPVVYRESCRQDRTADVCSPWNHYVRYAIDEMKRRRAGPGAMLGRSLVRTSGVLLRASRIEEVVSVNNWLLSAALCEEFPQRAILVRSINPAVQPDQVARLAASGYRLVASRTVYLLDTSFRGDQQSKGVREDRRLLQRGDYDQIGHEELTPADLPRRANVNGCVNEEKAV